MPLNDSTEGDEFDSQIQDEDASIYPTPGVEIGMELAHDFGSGSYAEDGRLEVAEDKLMMDGESGVGSAAMYGPTEIGSAAESGPSEIGAWEDEGLMGVLASQEGQAEIGGPASEDGQTEIGGPPSEDGQSEIGLDEYIQAPFESFMLDGHRIGASAELDYASEIGGPASEDGQTEIGVAAAVVKVVEKARDNRQPPPPMKAVDVDAPLPDPSMDEFLSDIILGAAAATGADPFPLTTQFMTRCRANEPPRYVRIDTEESYRQFRHSSSPELAELKKRLEDHMADPSAHDDDLSDDIEDLVVLGEEVQKAEKDKKVDLWMPKRFDGGVTSWREGDFVCASMVLPGGQVKICTTLEPLGKCIEEMGRHAAESGVPASSVVGVLDEMGCVLGAGTGLKEMAAAAPSLVTKPAPCVVRIEPKVSPALCALVMLVTACKQGVPGACDEWANLAALSPAPVKQAMTEAVALAKATA